MSTLITTCPKCRRPHELPADAVYTECPRCCFAYDIWDEDSVEDDTEPDYGGAFDGYRVHSDADPGL